MIGKPRNLPNIIGGAQRFTQPPVRPARPRPPIVKDDRLHGYNQIADVGACAHYRVIWANNLLATTNVKDMYTYGQKVNGDPRYYENLNFLRIQRFASNEQYVFYKNLRKVTEKHGVRLMYELDDIPFYDDIPLYNRNRNGFASPKIKSNIIEMMNIADEVTVSTNFMADYFRDKLTNTKITCIPNRLPKSWMDRFYNEDRLKVNFSKNKRKPRILYAGAGSHFSVTGSVEDDFTNIQDLVRKTVKDFQWIFIGGFPRGVADLIRSGKIEFHKFTPLHDFAYKINEIAPNILIAPLAKNIFNMAKSNIKLLEGGAHGYPVICQDICTYDDALYKFNTADELHDRIKYLTQDAGVYMKAVRKSRALIDERFWLEDNIDMWEELYKYDYQDTRRIKLNQINNV